MGLRANLTRALYVLVTVVVAVAAYLGLAALASPFLQVNQTSATVHTLTVVNARSSNSALPIRYARQLERVQGVKSVSYFTLQILQCKDGQTVTVAAYGGSGVDTMLAGAGFDAEMITHFQADPIGLLIGAKIAHRCGWQAGQGITPLTISGKPLALHVTAVARTGSDFGDDSAITHYAYINRAAPLGGMADTVIRMFASAQDPHALAAVGKHIDAAFATTDPPLTAYPNTAVKNAWARFGKAQNLLALVIAGLVICCALVLVSVLAHAAVQRRRRMAVLSVLGFPRAWQGAAFALEYAFVLLLGAVLGSLLGKRVPGWTSVLLHGLFAHVKPPLGAWLALPAGLACLWLMALVLPTLVLWRLRAADYSER